MKFNPIRLSGAYLIEFPAPVDNRGKFVKSFHFDEFNKNNAPFELKESYFSFSKKDVIRGMHFQLPPHHHSKVVYCPSGAILDVIVDLRKDSATYGECEGQILSADNNLGLYIPEGFAHGFKALTDDAMTYYLVSSVYNKDNDTGIRYDSIGFNWECENPIISARDLSFGTLNNFNSPF